MEYIFMRRVPFPQPRSPIKCTLLTVAITVGLLVPGTAARQPKHYPLESTAGLRLHNIAAEPAALHGKQGLRITGTEEAQRRLQAMTLPEVVRFPQFASIDGLDFANGVIEAEIAGEPAPGAAEGARGPVSVMFVGSYPSIAARDPARSRQPSNVSYLTERGAALRSSGRTSPRVTSVFGSANGGGVSRTASTTAKMAVPAPRVSDSVKTAATALAGEWRRFRNR
jgi:hypothetical protein